MKVPYLRPLLTLLTFFDVLIFKRVGILLEANTLKSEEEDEPPEVPVLKPVYCEVLTKCFDTDDQINWRKLCFNEAYPDDRVYHCGVAEDQQTVVEFYYPPYPCDKGYYGTPEVHGESVKMVCKICPEGRFNPERRWSPGNMDACRTHLHVPAEPHTVLFRPESSTDPAEYYCDATNGWASAYENLFCKPSYQPCSCTYQGKVCPGEEMLPDRRCVPKCEGRRLPEKNFSCAQSKVSAITTSKPIGATSAVETSTSLSSQSTTLSVGDDSTSRPPSKGDYGYLNIGLLCGGIVILLVLMIICYKKRSFCCKITKNVWHIDGDHNDARHAKNVSIYKTADEESASSVSTNGNVDNIASDAESKHGLLE